MSTRRGSVDMAAASSDGLGTLLQDNPIAVAIIGCEIAFRLVLAAGLAVRYLLRQRRLSNWLLLAVPPVDVVLLALVAIDLGRGTVATNVHSLAGMYLGISVAFGHRMVQWADVRVAHRFAGGPAPTPKARAGAGRASYEWRTFGLALIAAAIAIGTLLGLRFLVAAPDAGAALTQRVPMIGVVVAIWFVSGPLWWSGRTAADRVKI
ncbi:MAG: hypothetical protein WKF57_14210 [Nakamurella sp.]